MKYRLQITSMLGLMTLVAIIGNLAFWLGLIAGALWLLRHFGVIGR